LLFALPMFGTLVTKTRATSYNKYANF
jgi:hypothetical protein